MSSGAFELVWYIAVIFTCLYMLLSLGINRYDFFGADTDILAIHGLIS